MPSPTSKHRHISTAFTPPSITLGIPSRVPRIATTIATGSDKQTTFCSQTPQTIANLNHVVASDQHIKTSTATQATHPVSSQPRSKSPLHHSTSTSTATIAQTDFQPAPYPPPSNRLFPFLQLSASSLGKPHATLLRVELDTHLCSSISFFS